MKKISLVLILLLVISSVINFSVAFAETDLVYDLVFYTVKQTYGVEIENYNVTEQIDGTLYCSFKRGYAIVSYENNEPKIEQLWYDTVEYFDNYFGGGSLTEQTYPIEYVNKNTKNKTLAFKTPSYLIGGVTCVPNAATCILGFYDRYYDALIPNFTAGRIVASKYLYSSDDANVANASKQFAYDMVVNTPATDGVTVNSFNSGMRAYSARKNLNASFSSCMSWGRFNYDNAMSYLDSNIPLIIFTSGYNLVALKNNSNSDVVTMLVSNGTHAMAVFGYTEITYSLSNGSTKTNKYLNVSSGVDIMSNALVNIDSNISIDDAYAVTIK